MECQSAFIIFTLVISFTITRSEISSIPNSPDRVLLSLPSGDSLIGLEATTANGRQFHAFLGVPYAQPPVEALRFERPLPYSAGGIGKVHDCTVEKPSCSHYVLKTHKAPGCGIIDSIKRLRKQLKERKAEKKRRKRPQTTTTNAVRFFYSLFLCSTTKNFAFFFFLQPCMGLLYQFLPIPFPEFPAPKTCIKIVFFFFLRLILCGPWPVPSTSPSFYSGHLGTKEVIKIVFVFFLRLILRGPWSVPEISSSSYSGLLGIKEAIVLLKFFEFFDFLASSHTEHHALCSVPAN